MEPNREQKIPGSHRQLSILLYLIGASALVFGAIYLSSFLSSGSNLSLSDAVLNALSGGVELLAGWLAGQGKKLAILCVLLVVIAGLIYPPLVGRGFNFAILIVGGALLTWMITLWRRGSLS